MNRAIASGYGHGRYSRYQCLRIDWPHERVIRVTMAGPAFDASFALEFLGFTGPEAKEGLQAYLDERKPAFPRDCPL
jgi:hypothetical protein